MFKMAEKAVKLYSEFGLERLADVEKLKTNKTWVLFVILIRSSLENVELHHC